MIEAARRPPARKIVKRLGKWLAARKAIEIVEEGGVRVLQIGGNAIQSAMRLSAPDRIELDYVRAMMAFLLFHPNPRDVLVVDGFVNGSPAKGLCTQSFYDGAFAALRPGGVMVANFMADDKRIETHCGRIAQSFGRNPTLLLAEEEDNFIAFALRGGPPRIAWAELKARARAASALFGLPLGECVPSLRQRNPHTTRFLTL